MTIKRIDYIDVWRFFAVLLVIQSHVFLFSGIDAYFPQIETYSLQIDRLGELGVLIFFSISGFVICSGLNAEKQKTGRVCLSAFYARRFFRIMPPLWLYLMTLTLLNFLGIIKISLTQTLTSAAFLCNMPFPQACSWFAGHTWTLAYEEQFYIFFPLLFLIAHFFKNYRWILIALVGLIILSVTFRYNGVVFFADYCSYFVFLLAGCYTALLPAHLTEKLRKLPLSIWFSTSILLLSLQFLPLDIEKYAKTLCYPVLIQFVVFGTPVHCPKIGKMFRNTYFCYLGKISYSVYLWQELATAHYANTTLGLTLFYLLLVFIFSIISYEYFEIYCQKWGTAVSDRLKQKVQMRLI